jgi:hypothetical protein
MINRSEVYLSNELAPLRQGTPRADTSGRSGGDGDGGGGCSGGGGDGGGYVDGGFGCGSGGCGGGGDSGGDGGVDGRGLQSFKIQLNARAFCG